MSEIKITKEFLERAEKCTTVDELISLAKENGIELSAEEAEELLKKNISKKELTDEELDFVSSGKDIDAHSKRHTKS